MTIDLTGVRLKIGRAEEHFQSVKNVVSAQLKPEAYDAIFKVNADFTRYSVILKILKDIPFDQMALIAGDCVHNLRSALDHLIYSMAVHLEHGNIPTNWKKLAFPIAASSSDFADMGFRIKSLPDRVRTAIESVQPYNRPHAELPPLLGLLHYFDLADKHRVLNVCFTVIHQGHFTDIQNVPEDQAFQAGIALPGLKDGAEIAALIFDRPTPNVTYNWAGDISIGIRFPPGPLGEFGEISTILSWLIEDVREVIDIVVKEFR